jgi:hypothetical protein
VSNSVGDVVSGLCVDEAGNVENSSGKPDVLVVSVVYSIFTELVLSIEVGDVTIVEVNWVDSGRPVVDSLIDEVSVVGICVVECSVGCIETKRVVEPSVVEVNSESPVTWMPGVDISDVRSTGISVVGKVEGIKEIESVSIPISTVVGAECDSVVSELKKSSGSSVVEEIEPNVVGGAESLFWWECVVEGHSEVKSLKISVVNPVREKVDEDMVSPVDDSVKKVIPEVPLDEVVEARESLVGSEGRTAGVMLLSLLLSLLSVKFVSSTEVYVDVDVDSTLLVVVESVEMSVVIIIEDGVEAKTVEVKTTLVGTECDSVVSEGGMEEEAEDSDSISKVVPYVCSTVDNVGKLK